MTTDWKALCAELVAELEAWEKADHQFSDGGTVRADADYELAPRARIALSQPEPEGPTDEPLGDLIDKWFQEAFRKKPYGCKHPTHTYVACKAFEHGRSHAARTPLSQPEPEGLTDEEIEKSFQRWWFDEGSGMRPSNGENQEEHTRRVSQIAWSNGAYVARYSRPAIEPEGPTDEALRLGDATPDPAQPSTTPRHRR